VGGVPYDFDPRSNLGTIVMDVAVNMNFCFYQGVWLWCSARVTRIPAYSTLHSLLKVIKLLNTIYF
jgi:hypothetical protein